MIGDVPLRVAPNIDDDRFALAQTDPVAFHNRAIGRVAEAPNFPRAADHAAGLLFELQIAACMIGMPMGVPDLGQAPAALGAFTQDGGRIGRIDRRGLAARRIMDEETVIVRKAGELMYLEHGSP